VESDADSELSDISDADSEQERAIAGRASTCATPMPPDAEMNVAAALLTMKLGARQARFDWAESPALRQRVGESTE
jgi:hypothetical protein